MERTSDAAEAENGRGGQDARVFGDDVGEGLREPDLSHRVACLHSLARSQAIPAAHSSFEADHAQ